MLPQQAQQPQQVEQTVQKNESILNPTDLSMMVQDGRLSPRMTVADFFKQIGVDVNGPVTQLIQVMGQQSQMANPVNKMRAIAGQPGGMPQGQPPMPRGGQGGPPPGLRGLIGG